MLKTHRGGCHCGGNDTPLGECTASTSAALHALSDGDLARVPTTYADVRNDRWQDAAEFCRPL